MVLVVTDPGEAGKSLWRDVMLAGDEVDHGDEVADVAISACSSAGCLYESVGAFEQGRGASRGEEAADAIPVVADRLCDLGHVGQAAAFGPAAPILQRVDTLVTRQGHGVLEGEAHAVGPAGLQAEPRHGDDLGHGRLFVGERGDIAQDGVALLGEQLAFPGLLQPFIAPGLVDGVAH